ncbi:MAG: hypothetical protein ACI8WT_002631 [Clostridium sp.]|jgi:hypothetical protein
MRLFGPTHEDIWKMLSEDIGAKFIGKDSSSKKYEVIKKFHDWSIVLDTCDSNNRNERVYTRVYCAFLNEHGFKLKVFGEYFNNYFPNFFGMQDIKVNYDDLSDKFVIRSNSDMAIKIFMENSTIRELINMQPDMLLEIVSEEGCEVMSNVNSTLSVKIPGIIKNNEILKNIFELVGESLLEIEKISKEIQTLQVNNFTNFDVIKNSVKNTLIESVQYKNLKKDIINNVNKVIDKTSHYYPHKKNQVNNSELVNKNKIDKIFDKGNKSKKNYDKENKSEEINSRPLCDYTDDKSLTASDGNTNITIQTESIDVNNPKVDVNDLNIDTSNLKIDGSYLKFDDSYLKNEDSYLKTKE